MMYNSQGYMFSVWIDEHGRLLQAGHASGASATWHGFLAAHADAEGFADGGNSDISMTLAKQYKVITYMVTRLDIYIS